VLHSQVACALSVLEASHETRSPRIEARRIGSLFSECGINASSNDLRQGDAFPPRNSSQATCLLFTKLDLCPYHPEHEFKHIMMCCQSGSRSSDEAQRNPGNTLRGQALRTSIQPNVCSVDIGRHMKTTVDISDALFHRAKKPAARRPCASSIAPRAALLREATHS